MIIHFLRHASLCLWITLPIAALGSFWILPLLPAEVGVNGAPLLVAGWLVAVFAGVTWTANRLGLVRVQRLVRSADRAEREGLRDEAEKAFQSALGVLDSFWLRPRPRHNALLPLAGRMARYYLSESHLSAAAEDFIVRYLWAHPRDEEVAEQWVRHIERQGGLGDEHLDLADRLGNAHPRHPVIQRAVARLCLASERTDYAALQAYRRLCGEDGRVPPAFCADLARLFREDGRSDEWALQVLRQAALEIPTPAETANEIPLEPGRLPAREEGPALREMPAPVDEEDVVFRMSGAADTADETVEDERISLLTEPRWLGSARMQGLTRRGADALKAFRARLQRFGAVWVGWLRGVSRLPDVLRAPTLLVIFAIAAGAGWMALNVAGVFEPSPTETAPVDPPSLPVFPAADQFALQVAAYLKQDYALKLVEDLKKKGLNAYWIETASSGKTWYQVRIAPFPDQQSAREFGRDLKWKGVIDDFYVTSASR